MLKHIRQRGKSDCAIAVAAMLCDMSYAKALAAAGGRHKSGMTATELHILLNRMSPRWWRMNARWRLKPLATFPVYSTCAVMVVPKTDLDGDGHWVAIEGHMAHDPHEASGAPLCRYDGDWVVCTVIEF